MDSVDNRPNTTIGVAYFSTPILAYFSAPIDNFASHKMRRLEHNIWTHYAAEIPNGMVVYHWKKEAQPSISDFSTFVKLQTRRTGWRILCIYLAVVFLVGFFGSLGASAVWDHYHPSQATQLAQPRIPDPESHASNNVPQTSSNSAESEKK